MELCKTKLIINKKVGKSVNIFMCIGLQKGCYFEDEERRTEKREVKEQYHVCFLNSL